MVHFKFTAVLPLDPVHYFLERDSDAFRALLALRLRLGSLDVVGGRVVVLGGGEGGCDLVMSTPTAISNRSMRAPLVFGRNKTISPFVQPRGFDGAARRPGQHKPDSV